MTPSTAILQVFYQAAGHYVSAEQLCRAVVLSPHALAVEMADLQKIGYRIESHPHHGWRLVASPDRLTADDIKARMKCNVIGTEIIVFEQTASTNDVASSLATAGAREGLVVFAESQTKGRGRHGRVWVSPRGKGLWFSVILRPSFTPNAMSRLTIAASVAVVQAIQKTTRLDARIKWPNDVTLAGRKIAGIVTELHDAVAILGIGIDVNCGQEDFPPQVAAVATSLALAAGHSQDRSALAAAVLTALDDSYRQAQTDFDAVISAWAKACTTLGRHIAITVGQRRVEGIAHALDGDGALLLRRDNGHIERILGADIILEQS
jgi:BirA family biotin operon repressor/biotin-[acetyl-CoA-carboxylase] ligase